METKFRIVETEDYTLAVSEGNIENWYVDDVGIVRKSVTWDKEYWSVRKDYKKIIAYQPKKNSPELLPIVQYGNMTFKELNGDGSYYECIDCEVQTIKSGEFLKSRGVKLYKNKYELDLPLLSEIVVKKCILEDRVYCVDVQNYEFDTSPQTWDDEKFISEAEIQGNVYSIEGFVKAFNKTEINQDNLIIRFIKSEIVVEDDVNKLAYAYRNTVWKGDFSSEYKATEKGFIDAHKAATKVYSEEDLRGIAEFAFSFHRRNDLNDNELKIEFNRLLNKNIKSLKQPKTPKWFVAETEPKDDFESETGNCSILKTTTNSEGKQVLVGTYLYE